MKKVLIMLLATTISLSTAVTAFAADTTTTTTTIAVEDNLAYNQKYVATEKADKNTLYYYREQSEQFSKAYIAYLDKQAKSITAGTANDYDKAKLISKWVSDNIWYDWDASFGQGINDGSNFFNADHSKYEKGIELIAGDKTVCDGYADFTVGLLRAAGIPAKEMFGYLGSQNHAWVEAYIEGKWVFIDATLNSRNSFYKGKFSEQRPSDGHYFDLPLEKWSLDHRVNPDLMKITGENYVFNGKILFYSVDNGVIQGVIKEVDTNLSAGDKLGSTYGFKAGDLYKDAACTQPWDLDKDTVKEAGCVIYVKDYKGYQYTIYFDSRGGTAVDPVTVGAESKNIWVLMSEPSKPTREGYDFIGWYPANYQYYDGAQVFDFKTQKVSDGEKFYAIWRDKTTGTIAPTTTGITTTPTVANTATTGTTTTTATTAKVTGWSKAYGNWRYYDSNGNMQRGWINDNGNWYYLEGDGRMKTGWLYDRGHWYYLNDNGAMAHDTTVGGFVIGSNGARS